jgi:hypothetical protein
MPPDGSIHTSGKVACGKRLNLTLIQSSRSNCQTAEIKKDRRKYVK